MNWQCTSRVLAEQYRAEAEAAPNDKQVQAKVRARLAQLSPGSYKARHATAKDGTRWWCQLRPDGVHLLARWAGTEQSRIEVVDSGRLRDALIRKHDPDADIEAD